MVLSLHLPYRYCNDGVSVNTTTRRVADAPRRPRAAEQAREDGKREGVGDTRAPYWYSLPVIVMNYHLVQLLEVIILYFPSLGKSSSVPLSLLCTDWDRQNRVHDFLSRYDELISFAKQAADKQASGSPVADGRGGYGMLRR